MNKCRILVTGVAGFIGMHVAKRLVESGHQVVGIDSVNDYYSVSLKEDRLRALSELNGDFTFVRLDIADRPILERFASQFYFDVVCHLAAQAGVRYSIKNPSAYASSNLVGFVNMLELARGQHVKHFVYASSSSVYGGNLRMPFSEEDGVDHPVSLYAATKKSNELMAHAYSHLYSLPTSGLRFFTVYGPWGRPDMAPFLFADAIIAGRAIEVFNHGRMKRDFTYIDDIVTGVERVLLAPPTHNEAYDRTNPNPAESWAPYRVYNIGRSDPVPLMDFIGELESAIGRKAILNFKDMAPGDVVATFSDTSRLETLSRFKPAVDLQSGVQMFVRWYRGYYGR